ncbi:MAG: hypothetical protein R6U45_02200 [Thioalkalivibrio sp.]|uniref:hypothetical protein n=1 Tax=Thioalkalivibrio sp. TaxID=2093813 RepID=UPI003975869D
MMPGWVETHLGLIFQVYGLAFFVLGVAALLSMRRERGAGLAAHLGWLATFGMLHELQAFIDGERLRVDPATREVPVIAVTANAMRRDIERGKAAGFEDYIVKPINVRDLFAAIDPYLEPARGVS